MTHRSHWVHPSSTMDSLCMEILDHICEKLPPHSLTRLAACNHRLCHASRRVLYKDIRIGTSTLGLTSTLATNPHLAEHVTTFRIVVHANMFLADTFNDTLSSALSPMHKLKSLVISLPPEANRSSALPSIPSATYPQLCDFRASFGFDSNVGHFLKKVPNLVLLKLTGSDSASDPCSYLPPSCLPCLEVFSGTMSAAQCIVPGRPVHSVFLQAGELTAQLVPTLSLSSTAVTVLSFLSDSPTAVLEALAKALPSLQYVRVRTKQEVWQGYHDNVSLRPLIIYAIELLTEGAGHN